MRHRQVQNILKAIQAEAKKREGDDAFRLLVTLDTGLELDCALVSVTADYFVVDELTPRFIPFDAVSMIEVIW